MAEGLVEAGGKVHCLDILSEPDDSFGLARKRVKSEHGGSLEYHQVDVSNSDQLEKVIEKIASEEQRLDGLIAGQCLIALPCSLRRGLQDTTATFTPTGALHNYVQTC